MGGDGFRLILQGAGEQQFQPDNLRYSFDDKLSLSGLFQRVDNFLGKGLDESIERQRENARQESAELETVKAALGKEFPQKDELTLARENHGFSASLRRITGSIVPSSSSSARRSPKRIKGSIVRISFISVLRSYKKVTFALPPAPRFMAVAARRNQTNDYEIPCIDSRPVCLDPFPRQAAGRFGRQADDPACV